MSKKLITSNISVGAKMPIIKTTLDHLQQAYNEQIQAICRNIGTDDAGGTPGAPAFDIVYGLQSTLVGSAFTANRGYIYTGGELFSVPAASFTVGAGEYPIFVLSETYAAGDPIEFTDGNSYNIHQIRTATLVSGTTSTANYLGTFSEFTNKKLPTTVSSGSGITNGTNITSAFNLLAKKDHLGVVVLQGLLQMNSSFAVGQVIATLPTTHRPVIVGGGNPRLGLVIVNGASYGTLHVEINPSGQITAVKDNSGLIGNNATIYFEGISFYNV
jgi:hypothetical protein